MVNYVIILEGSGSIEVIKAQFESFMIQIVKAGHQINHAIIASPDVSSLGIPKLSSIELPTSATINVGEYINLSAKCNDQYGKIINCPKLVWFSSNTIIATVDETGKVLGKSYGKADISATD